MTDSFFGFNNVLTGFEEGLHDDPGQGLDEEAEEYDALNDETFGADSIDEDWEQDHEKLAQITENSRVHRSSYNSATDGNETRTEADYEEDDDAGFEDLNLEASLSQLVTDDDDALVENKKPKTHRTHMGTGVLDLEVGYSCSPPSQVNVWGVQREDQQHALKPHNVRPTKKYCTVEELERTLKQSSGMVNQRKIPSAVRLEDLERDLTSSKNKVPPGFARPMFSHPHQDQVRNGIPPGFGQQQQQQHRNMQMRGPYPPQMILPPGLDFRHHRPMGPGPGPNMFRFLPPHLMMAAQQHYQPRPNFRPPYQPGPMGRGIPRMPGLRYPGPGPRYPRENGDFRDEYDGLMTEREVQWLLNIQQININTAQPYVDDFYFTVFTARHPKQPGDRRRTRERRDSHRDSRPEQPQPGRVYTPLQFENSLGKLQCGSVTAPRKIIDMDVVSNEVADPSVMQTSQRDTRKAKQLLLTIEQLYLVLLKLEDLECPLARANPAADTESSADRPALLQRLTGALSAEDKLQATMCVRKGKELVVRLLPHVSPDEDGEWLSSLWCTVFKGLIPIGRRDAEPSSLPRFYPHLKRWLQSADVGALERAVRSLRTTPPARNTLAYALSNKFGVSACCALITRASELPESAQSPDWLAFLHELLDSAPPAATARPTPLEPLDAATVSDTLRRSGIDASDSLTRLLAAVDS